MSRICLLALAALSLGCASASPAGDVSAAGTHGPEARALLSKLIAHRTYHEPGNEPPGNSPAFRALEADLQAFAKAHGLTFSEVDHLAYEIGVSSSAGKSNDDKVGVLVHADVVPADEPGWLSDPFVATVRDRALYGRGALDDKGALVAVLFALVAIEEAKLPLKRAPVLIIGTSEETHWDGIERFIKARGAPARSFVADGSFPLSLGEKGVSTASVTTLQTPGTGPGLILVALEGGQVSNQVPSTARVVLRGEPARLNAALAGAQDKAWASAKREGEALVVEFSGKAAHGATPHEGENAIQRLLRFVTVHAPLQASPCAALIELLDRTLDGGYDAGRIGLDGKHPRFSGATVNLGTLSLAAGKCTAKLNLRWPPPRTSKEVIDTVRANLIDAAAGELELEVTGGGLDPFIIDDDPAFTDGLKAAYTAVTGKPADAVTLSGTTYAKAIPGGAVTFGPSGPEVHGDRIHGPNEHITFDELDELIEIYTRALITLGSD